MPRETAAQRRAREHMEAQAARVKWVESLPMQVLRDIARAIELDVVVNIKRCEDTGHESGVQVTFQVMGEDEDPIQYQTTVVVGSPDICTVQWAYEVPGLLDDVQHIKEEKVRRYNLRVAALNKLTQEEREVLGL